MLALSLLIGAAHVCSAQPAPDACGTELSATAGSNLRLPGPGIVVTGPFHALVVFVQYRDDTQIVHGNCGDDDWPLGTPASPTAPATGHLLLDASAAGPYEPASLTSYFREQSRGNFTLYGDEFAYVTRSPEAAYLFPGGTNINFGKISTELLEDIQNPAVPPNLALSDYDADGNGQLDHLFVVLRSKTYTTGIVNRPLTSGISDLGIPFGPDGLPLVYGGVRVHPGLSGSFNLFQTIEPLRDNVLLLAHEFGHDIWVPSVHLPPLAGNGIPARPPVGSAATSGDQFVAHALMISGDNSAGKVTGGYMTSAAERAYVARTIADPARRWITCTALTDGLTYSVADVAAAGDCFTLGVPSEPGSVRELYLSNVQRASPFNTLLQPLTLVSMACPGCVQIEIGATTTGLLVEAVRRGPNPGDAWTRDVVPADNQLSGFQGCDFLAGVGPTLDEVFAGDFWRPGLDRQLTPWTRPNVYGYNTLADILPAQRPAVFASGLHAIDDIRQGAGTNVDFTYHRVYTDRPVAYVREDWWIGNEIAGLTFNEVRVQSGATLTVAATVTFNGDLVVEAGGRLIVAPGTTLRFAPGKRIIVYGTFSAEGTTGAPTTLTATGPDGWGGIHVGPAPGSPSLRASALAALPPAATLSGVTVSGVRYLSPLIDDVYQPYVSVEVVNRRVVLTNGTRILGSAGSLANGVRAVGAAAQVIVASGSEIRDSDGVGVYAIAGARVFVTNGAFVRFNSFGGLYLNGYGTRADVDGQARVDGNTGVGIIAESQAHARVRADGTVTATSVSENRGGPTALTGGSVDGGQCTPTNASIRPNLFERNHLNGQYDARAEGGSTVAARYAFWGPGRAALVLVKDKSSTTAVFPVAPTATSPDPACPMVSQERGMAAPAGSRGADPDGMPGRAGRGGNVTAAVVALAGQARQGVWDGDAGSAFALLDEAARAATTEDDREAVFEAVGALVAAADSSLDVSAVVSSLGARAAGTGADRPWARRALAVAYASTRRPAEADGLADALTAQDAGTAHAVFGHGLRVRLAVEADSAALAVDRLSDFGAVVAQTDTLAAEAFASAFALVAASFPEADLTGVTRGVAGRGTTSSAQAGTPGRAALADDVAVYPNPAAGRGTVRMSVSRPSETATAAVYDALGRRVAVLHDGPLAAGAHAFSFDASRLAPGVYVVEVHVSPEAGPAWTAVRRVTVAR